jgi:hypothetical protein
MCTFNWACISNHVLPLLLRIDPWGQPSLSWPMADTLHPVCAYPTRVSSEASLSRALGNLAFCHEMFLSCYSPVLCQLSKVGGLTTGRK